MIVAPSIYLCQQSLDIFPLFASQLQGHPYIFYFSCENPNILEYNTCDYDEFQSQIESELKNNCYTWGIGAYLEDRSKLLRHYPQLMHEKRVYHMGLDIIVPAGLSLHAPLDATVYKTGVDSGLGNYGGYVILKHTFDKLSFYSFYGHLDSRHTVNTGDFLPAGQIFASIGEKQDSGFWFTHTHLQILTEKAVKSGRTLHGYVSADELANIDSLFPSPYLLFRY